LEDGVIRKYLDPWWEEVVDVSSKVIVGFPKLRNVLSIDYYVIVGSP
jgi:hypothetical protein